MQKVIVAGSRNFSNYLLVKENLDKFLQQDVIIVSGCAKGVDTLGEQYAKERGLKIERYPAKWNDLSVPNCKVKQGVYGSYNVLAGFNRNIEMLNSILNNPEKGSLIAFWDGKSKGTENMISLCKKNGINVIIVDIT